MSCTCPRWRPWDGRPHERARAFGGTDMRSARDVPAPGARELRAAGLAALAEAGVVYLPLYMVFSETRGLELDIELLAVPFLAAFVVGTLLACRFRSSGNLATAAVVVAVLVALRVVSLGSRDWRAPIEAEL